MIRLSLAFEGDKPFNEYHRYARLAEKYGFYSFQIYEHITFRPAWAIAFHIAKSSKTIKIGPVTIPVMLYHPAYIAANLATLNEATGGRALVGISRGAFYEYLHARPEKPIRAVKEAIEIIDLLLHGGGTYLGEVFKVSRKAKLRLPTDSNVEVYVGSSGPKMITMASGLKMVKGIVVDNLWNPSYLAKVRESVKLGASRVGRKPQEISIVPRPFSCVMRKREEAKELMEKELARYLPSLVGDSPMLAEAGVTFEEIKEYSRAPKNNKELGAKLLKNFSASGNPEEIIEQTERMIKAGATHICYGHPLGREVAESIRLMGEKVKPYFQDRV